MLLHTISDLATMADAAPVDTRTALDSALMAFGTAALAALTWLLKLAADYAAARIKSARWAGIVSRVDDTAIRVVRDVEATYVADLEAADADGVITAEEKAQAKAKAMAALKSYLGSKGLGELTKLLGVDSLDGFLGASIEHALAEHQNAEAAAVPPSSSNAA